MSPIDLPFHALVRREDAKPSTSDGLIIEAWAQGYLVGSLVILAFITMANMRRGVLLHKLILLELILGLWQGFWLFFDAPVYAWWLSVGGVFLNLSWSLHNVISWMKIKPFLSRTVSLIFIGTVILVQPYWVVEMYATFAFFHNQNDLFRSTRPWEALCRDPWWIFTTVQLFWTIKTQYELTLREIIQISPRFGVMLLSMLLSIIFIILDICSVTGAFGSSLPVGINPFWKLAFVFKCLTDSVVLDDFKTALDRLRAFKISRIGSFSQDTTDRRTWNDHNLINTWESLDAGRRRTREPFPSPDGDLVHTGYFARFKPSRKHPKKKKDEPSVRKPSVRKESVIKPDYIPRDFAADVNLENIVPDALHDPPSTLEHAYIRQARNGNPRLWDSHHFREEDYAQALKDVHGHGASVDSSKDIPKPID